MAGPKAADFQDELLRTAIKKLEHCSTELAELRREQEEQNERLEELLRAEGLLPTDPPRLSLVGREGD